MLAILRQSVSNVERNLIENLMKTFPSIMVTTAGFIAVLSTAASAATTTDFTGNFDVSNWTAEPATGSIVTADAPNSIQLISSDEGTGTSVDTDFFIVAPAAGTVQFSWNFETTDSGGGLGGLLQPPAVDPFGWILNGTFTQVTDNSGSNTQSGVTDFFVDINDTFGFRANSTDDRFGAATTTVNDFSFSAIPEPSSALGTGILLGMGVFTRLRTKRR